MLLASLRPAATNGRSGANTCMERRWLGCKRSATRRLPQRCHRVPPKSAVAVENWLRADVSVDTAACMYTIATAHNPEVAGSNPAPATRKSPGNGLFSFSLRHHRAVATDLLPGAPNMRASPSRPRRGTALAPHVRSNPTMIEPTHAHGSRGEAEFGIVQPCGEGSRSYWGRLRWLLRRGRMTCASSGRFRR